MKKQKEHAIQWLLLFKGLVLSALFCAIFIIFNINIVHLAQAHKIGLNTDTVILLGLIILAIMIIYYIYASRCLHETFVFISEQLHKIQSLDKSAQALLLGYFLWLILAATYMFTSSQYNLFILIFILPILSMPLMVRFIPSTRQYKPINLYFKQFFSENEEISFFYICILIATTWFGIIWGTNLITETVGINNKITTTVQSLTACIGPLAFYITYKTYQRKSGIKFMLKISQQAASVYPTFIDRFILLNEKDRSYIILKAEIIFNNQYITKINIDQNTININAYDPHICICLPFTEYEISQDATQKISIEEIFEMPKKILIECAQGWYQSNEFLNFDDVIVIDQKADKTNYPLQLTGQTNLKYINTVQGLIKLILPKKFMALIILETFEKNGFWIYKYTQNINQAQVFKATYNADLNTYYIDAQSLIASGNAPHSGILDKIDPSYLQDSHSFENWKNIITNTHANIDLTKVYFILND